MPKRQKPRKLPKKPTVETYQAARDAWRQWRRAHIKRKER